MPFCKAKKHCLRFKFSHKIFKYTEPGDYYEGNKPISKGRYLSKGINLPLR